MNKYGKDPNIEKGIIFNSAEINGKIEWCDANKLGTTFKVENSEIEYWFLPVRIKDKRFQIFCRDLKKGDLVKKMSNDTILYLTKESGEIIKYDFVSYINETEKIIPARDY